MPPKYLFNAACESFLSWITLGFPEDRFEFEVGWTFGYRYIFIS